MFQRLIPLLVLAFVATGCASGSDEDVKTTPKPQSWAPEVPISADAQATEPTNVPPEAIPPEHLGSLMNAPQCPALHVTFPQSYDGHKVWVTANCATVFFKPTITKQLILSVPGGGLLEKCSGGTDMDYDKDAATLQLVDHVGANEKIRQDFMEANPHFAASGVSVTTAPFQPDGEVTVDKGLANSFWHVGPIANVTLTMRGVCLLIERGTAPRELKLNELKLSSLLQQTYKLEVHDQNFQKVTHKETWSIYIKTK